MSTRAQRPKATPADTTKRVDRIADIMRAGEWVRGESAEALAAEWGLSVSRVEDLSAEAWRLVCRAADNPQEARPNIVGTLMVALERAAQAGKYSDVAKIADVWTRIIGAREPERREEVSLSPEQARAKWKELTGREYGE